MNYKQQVDSIIKYKGTCHLPFQSRDHGMCTGCFYPLFRGDSHCDPQLVHKVALMIEEKDYDIDSCLFEYHL